jgi:AraC family transcriptional regulator
MPRLTLRHLRHLHQEASFSVTVQEKESFSVAGLMTLTRSQKSPECSILWNWLKKEVQGIEEGGTPLQYYGITYYPDNRGEYRFLYMAAIEVNSSQIVNPALVIKTLPASSYIRVLHQGSRKELPLTMDYVYHTWLPKSGKCLASPIEIEPMFGGFNQKSPKIEIFIPITE